LKRSADVYATEKLIVRNARMYPAAGQGERIAGGVEAVTDGAVTCFHPNATKTRVKRQQG
jgi:hypothetical protein